KIAYLKNTLNDLCNNFKRIDSLVTLYTAKTTLSSSISPFSLLFHFTPAISTPKPHCRTSLVIGVPPGSPANLPPPSPIPRLCPSTVECFDLVRFMIASANLIPWALADVSTVAAPPLQFQ
ncbi:hypothetical protein HAX54_041624, partial [Datura stramonium]|nr:hypothetical protein [Datura stramonium]